MRTPVIRSGDRYVTATVSPQMLCDFTHSGRLGSIPDDLAPRRDFIMVNRSRDFCAHAPWEENSLKLIDYSYVLWEPSVISGDWVAIHPQDGQLFVFTSDSDVLAAIADQSGADLVFNIVSPLLKVQRNETPEIRHFMRYFAERGIDCRGRVTGYFKPLNKYDDTWLDYRFLNGVRMGSFNTAKHFRQVMQAES